MTEIGIGRLSWPSSERVSDRYGVVMLMADGDSLNPPSRYVSPSPDVIEELQGKPGTLIAEVLETRESSHIGDFFRGLFPETPEVGERIELGTGRFFAEEMIWGALCVGLQPDDERDSDWLDPRALYRAHEQTVRLTFNAVTPDPLPRNEHGGLDLAALDAQVGLAPMTGAEALDAARNPQEFLAAMNGVFDAIAQASRDEADREDGAR